MSERAVAYEATATGHLMREHVERLGASLLKTDRWLAGPRAQGVLVAGLRLRMPNEEHPECLVVCRGVKEGVFLIGFHSADTPSEALRGAVERIENGSMIWREELPFE